MRNSDPNDGRENKGTAGPADPAHTKGAEQYPASRHQEDTAAVRSPKGNDR
jgi:hypothetical protein